jgi:hypothetical protein
MRSRLYGLVPAEFRKWNIWGKLTYLTLVPVALFGVSVLAHWLSEALARFAQA